MLTTGCKQRMSWQQIAMATKMAPLNRRALDIRWIKKPRYRKFVVIGSIIFSVNVLLVHVLVNSYRDPSLEEEDPSGRGRYHVEVRVACIFIPTFSLKLVFIGP